MLDPSALEPGTIIAGRYRVASKIGHGGMGAVYHVHHVHTDESLALKVVHAQVLRDAAAIERFRREARAPAKITSEHVARVTDADTAADLDGAPFYVMEFLRGRDLERVLAEDGPLSPALVVEYLRQMARALDKAHAIGIIHRDLKPENLFLTHREDGSPCIKLLDFGIARLAGGDTGATQIGGSGSGGGADNAAAASPIVTQVGLVFGTPNYMAPEQSLADHKQVGPATDVWAIGLLAFKLLVGEEFFTGKTSAQVYAQVLTQPIPVPSSRSAALGSAFDVWFARCVDREASRRFSSAGLAIQELATALGVLLPERQSNPSLGSDPRASQPSFAAIAPGPSAAAAGAPLTVLPAGVPARTKLRTIGIAAALAVALGGGVLFFALRRPADSAVGIVASATAATAAPSPSASPSSVASSDAPPAASSASVSPLVPMTNPSGAAPSPHGPSAGGEVRTKPRPTAPPKADPAPAPAPAALTREQKKRLDALEHLCNQGTYSAAECQSKRQAIIHGGS